MADSHHTNASSSYVTADENHTRAKDSDVEAGQEGSAIDADVVMPLASQTSTLSRGDTQFSLASRSRSQSDSQGFDTASPTTAITPATAVTSSGQSDDNLAGGYFGTSLRSPTSRRSLRMHTGSTQSSSGSLQTLAEREAQDNNSLPTVKRATSTRVRQTPPAGRRHSKSASMSQPITNFRRLMNNEHPVYPEQSLASLSPAFSGHSQRPHVLRTRSSHPAQKILYSDMNDNYGTSRDRLGVSPSAHTADNTPMSSPGLYTNVTDSRTLAQDHLRPTTPTLHHLQTPRETHAAEIDHDYISGNKILNDYEMVSLIGRGEYGKVKLGRHMKTGEYVAIKIVPRYSKVRRLGRIGEPQDQTKREIAILKKARHANVVSLLEVIDDPSKGKVYLILEYVEKGEIKWRRRGIPAITKINNARFQQEAKGVSVKTDISGEEKWAVQTAIIRQKGLEKARMHQPHSSSVAHYYPAWDIEEESDDLHRIASFAPSLAASVAHSATNSDHVTPSRTPSQDDYRRENFQQILAGSMYGAYADEGSHHPERKYSIATALSHMSSEFNFDNGTDDELNYVPSLKLHDAKEAFRQTLLGLEFLHAVGIIHRDIKPSNLLLGAEEVVKISDFGVSYFGPSLTVQFPSDQEVKGNDVREEDAKPLDDERELARSVGTPGFWAPELCYMDEDIFEGGRPPKITGAIDLWALGITLYAMVYARLPFYATDELGLNDAICKVDPIMPATRLVPVDTQFAEFTLESKHVRSGMRLDWDLKFENVPSDLRDLISKLLAKDPSKRITIAEVKQHPWVLKDLEDPVEFLKDPEFSNIEHQEPIPVNDDDISTAVTKRSIYTEVQKGVKALVNAFKGATGRKRGVSTSSNTAASKSSESVNSALGSNTSTVGGPDRERGREARRTSLHNDELLNALHRHRELSGHPLSQSETASPDNQELPSYFPEQPAVFAVPPGVSPRVQPEMERPKLPERAISALSTLSTADSVSTIRASQVNPYPLLDLPKAGSQSSSIDSAHNIRVRTAGLWEGAAKTLTRLTSRDRRFGSSSRSPSASGSSLQSDARTAPSLAISNTQASGSIETPDALLSVDERHDRDSRASSMTSSPVMPSPHFDSIQASADAAFDRAQEINQRRHIQESLRAAEASFKARDEEPIPAQCPPSPDDLTFTAREHTSPVIDTISPLNQHERPPMHTAASSVDDFSSSSVTQSTSNPSFVATSGASSPPDEDFVSAEYRDTYFIERYSGERKPDFMRSGDTVTPDQKPRHHTSTAPALEQQVDYCEGDDEESDDDDDGVVMMGTTRR